MQATSLEVSIAIDVLSDHSNNSIIVRNRQRADLDEKCKNLGSHVSQTIVKNSPSIELMEN